VNEPTQKPSQGPSEATPAPVAAASPEIDSEFVEHLDDLLLLAPRRRRWLGPSSIPRGVPLVGIAILASVVLRLTGGSGASVASADVIEPASGGQRFTLRLGQGFRFKDGAVVVKQDDQPDVVFKYLPPQVGGMALRYNPISQQVETGLEPTLTAPVPLLLSAHIATFEAKPDVARITSGDIASYSNQAPIELKTRYLLLMNQAGDQYLLTLDELEAVEGKYDDWRIGFAYEKVQLPVGLAGGKINKPLPGKLIFRDWYRTKMIERVDLTSGKEDMLVDGILPSTVGDRLLGYGDSSGAYVVRDAAGTALNTIRFNEQVLGPVLSPDGTRLLGCVYREGPGAMQIGEMRVPGAAVLSVGVFDLTGKEIVSFVGYDDATWTPDGKIIATGKLNDPGLFELDPATKNVRAIDAQLGAPFQPSVSPDGKTIAFVTGEKIWLIDRDGKNLRQLFPHGMAQQRPAFSPDGTKIAAIIVNQLGISDSGEVFVIDIETREITPIRTSAGSSLVPDTSTRLNWIS
jgi:WD40 repeat protein